MDTPSAMCIGLGILIIVGRAPLMFAPHATLRFYRRHFLSTNAQFRARVGLSAIMFAIAFLYASLHAPVSGDLLQVFAWFGVAAALIVFGFPSLFRSLSLNIVEHLDEATHYGLVRTGGFLAVIVGVALVYVGLYVI